MSKKAEKVPAETGTNDNRLVLRVSEIRQNKHVMYAFVATSSQLRTIATVSRRTDDGERGFQRHLKESRLKQIARYIDDRNGVIPNNIILDFFDDDVKVDTESQTISIPTDRKTAWVIDGQHRLFGFEYAKKQCPLLVIAFLQLPLEEKVNVFVTINTEQKRLPSSLCLDLLNIIGSDQDATKRCTELVGKLNEEEDSPWYDLVDMTGEGAGYISLVNFVRKIKPLITSAGVLRHYTFQDQYGALANYWSAIKALYADQWGKKNYVLTKTLGFGALMNLFPTVFTKTLALKNDFKVSSILDLLKPMKDLCFDAQTLGSGAGNKAEIAAGQILADELDKAISSMQPEGSQSVLKLS